MASAKDGRHGAAAEPARMDDPQPRPRLSEDAAIVLALAETAIPFAAAPEDEAERWVRILRLHGEVGCALQSLGVPEGPLESAARTPSRRGRRSQGAGEVVALVERRARGRSHAHGAPVSGTVDILFALVTTYGSLLDRALYVRGTTRAELLERLSERRRRTAPAAQAPLGARGASPAAATSPLRNATK